MNDQDKKRIEELESEVARLRQTSFYKDSMTGLFSKKGLLTQFEPYFQDALYVRDNNEVHRRRLRIEDMSCIVLDIDDFKKVNDTYGHDVGDLVLNTVAKYLKNHIRALDDVGRWGGEEFVVVLMGAGEDICYTRANELRLLMAELEIPELNGGRITGSFGVASIESSSARTLEELIGHADEAMYEAKKNGKNRVVRYSEIE